MKEAGGRRQGAGGRGQKAGGRRQGAEGRGQEAGGRRQKERIMIELGTRDWEDLNGDSDPNRFLKNFFPSTQ